ncbi:hypothetical protein BH10PSE2_BH10PSE2_24780 [soil metagenome]
MLMLALLIAGLSGQETAYSGAGSSETYSAPVIRPYEPPSEFGRQVAEGDADVSVRNHPIAGPVAVEAYRDTYERSRSRGELSYDQGVEQARVSQNARMGSLDGVWQALDPQGRPVADLVLSDRGPGTAVEGAINLTQTRATVPIASVVRSAAGVEISVASRGRPVTLRLQPGPGGWSGVLTGPAGSTPVTLAKSS